MTGPAVAAYMPRMANTSIFETGKCWANAADGRVEVDGSPQDRPCHEAGDDRLGLCAEHVKELLP